MTDQQPNHTLPPDNDVRAQTDVLRHQHRVVQNEAGDYILLHHADVVAAAKDNRRFSSRVSRFLQVPNGLDGAEHHRFRQLIDRHLSVDALTPFIAVFTQLATKLARSLPKGTVLNAVSDIGAVFAVRAQCAWLGWPTELEPILLQWMRDNHGASRAQDHEQMAQVAHDFDDIVRSVVRPRREAEPSSPLYQADDVTSRLCRESIDGRQLTETELVSILRNWTGGDLGSIALCVGVIVVHLAQHPALAITLAAAPDAELEAAIDEMLRVDNPFIANRRITTCPVSIGDHHLPSGARVQLNWTSANRDETVFGHDNVFSPQTNAPHNLVYGIGKHVCPGRTLATWQLRIATQALLAHSRNISLAPDHALVREQPPVGGYHFVPVILR